MDFSVFSIIREMLYLPMKTEEKFRSKAIIDVFASRTAKAFAAFFILFIDYIPFKASIFYTLFIMFGLWMLVVRVLFSKKTQGSYT